MATEAQIKANRENAKKAGRKPGLASINAEKARAILSQMVFDEITPIGKKLISESKKGNVQAIKELLDRAFGKPNQAIDAKVAITMAEILKEATKEDEHEENTG